MLLGGKETTKSKFQYNPIYDEWGVAYKKASQIDSPSFTSIIWPSQNALFLRAQQAQVGVLVKPHRRPVSLGTHQAKQEGASSLIAPT